MTRYRHLSSRGQVGPDGRFGGQRDVVPIAPYPPRRFSLPELIGASRACIAAAGNLDPLVRLELAFGRAELRRWHRAEQDRRRLGLERRNR